MDPRDPMAGPGMGRGIPRAGVLRRESHGSRKLEKNSVGARGEGGVTIGSGCNFFLLKIHYHEPLSLANISLPPIRMYCGIHALFLILSP